MEYEHEWQENQQDRRVGFPPQVIDHTLPAQDDDTHELAMEYVRSRGINPGTAEYNQWYGSQSAGDGFQRVVIPALGEKGSQFWQARYLDNVPAGAPNGQIPRYQSPHGKRGSALVFCYPPQGKLPPRVMVCEGPFDALSAADHGWVGIALMGITPSREAIFHLRNVLHKYPHPIMMVADADALSEMVTLGQAIGVPAVLDQPVVGFKDICDMDSIMRLEYFTALDQKYEEVRKHLCEGGE